MSRLLFAKGARGQAIEDLQRGLQFTTQDIDGAFGNQTRTAVSAFQTGHSLPATGDVDDGTWQSLLNKPIPTVFERCLALTAAFEGHGFSLAQGNFDGAGITWGIIGFTLDGGELADIIHNIQATRPDLVKLAFDDLTPKLLDVMAASPDDQLAFADSISIGAKKVRLADPWRAAFDLFGKFPEVRAEQLRRARDDYFTPCLKTAEAFGLKAELGIALAFDIHVQNGLVKKAAADQVRNATPPPADEEALRVLMANAVADVARLAFREDVRSRKLAIAQGGGTVHGELFQIDHWGIGELPAVL